MLHALLYLTHSFVLPHFTLCSEHNLLLLLGGLVNKVQHLVILCV